MNNLKILAVIEEIGDISTSGAIVNYNLCQLLGHECEKLDILTLDSISQEYIDAYKGGEIFLHPKNNLTTFQKWVEKSPFQKVYALMRVFLANDFQHYNRIKNIRKFLNSNEEKYDLILLLSAGLGFTPHHAITKKNKVKTIAVYHDPYPISCYPGEFKSGKRWPEFFRIKRQQKSFDLIDHLIFPSQRLYEWYLNDYEIQNKKVKIVPHAVNFEFEVVPSVNEKIVIAHIGTLLKPRNPYSFLKVFNEVNASNVIVEFHGGINPFVFESIKQFDNGRTVQINNGRIEYQSALEKLGKVDFQLLIESDSEDNPFLPTKFVDYVNIGKPIIALTSSNSEVSRLLGDDYPFKCGLNDENAIMEILQKRIHNGEMLVAAKRKITELQHYFSKEQIVMSYNALTQLI